MQSEYKFSPTFWEWYRSYIASSLFESAEKKSKNIGATNSINPKLCTLHSLYFPYPLLNTAPKSHFCLLFIGISPNFVPISLSKGPECRLPPGALALQM